MRQRNVAAVPKKKDATSTGIAAPRDSDLDALVKTKLNNNAGSEWDYKLAITVLTILAFITRFWGISHPNEVVFDEVHFGKVCIMSTISNLRSRMIAELTVSPIDSLHPTTSKEPTSSMSILLLASFSSP